MGQDREIVGNLARLRERTELERWLHGGVCMAWSMRPLRTGETVRARGERWRVIAVEGFDGCALVELAGIESSNAARSAHFILPFETIDRVPVDVNKPRVVRRAVWRRVVRGVLSDATPSWAALRAAASANVVLLPYQLEPALAMTRGLACRMLLADEVGLGKTIQAGLMVAELLARERHVRVLIVTPAGLRHQWREELHERFAVDAAVMDAAALVRATADLPLGVNPWAVPRVVVTSIDFLKRADVIRALEPLVWDLVVFDEAHALCGRSDRALAADLVAGRGRRVVLITATPHSGDSEGFDRLRALGRVAADDRLIVFRRSRQDAGLPRVRVVRRIAVTLTPDESRLHRMLERYAELVAREAPAEHAAGARLVTILLARRASSSAASLARSVERRIALLGTTAAPPDTQLRLPMFDGHLAEDEEPAEELAVPALTDAAAEHRWLQRLLALARRVGEDSKIRALRRLLRRTSEPALVFTEYRDTLQQLVSTLAGPAALLHGGLTPAEREREARRFTHGNARLLLATDAASEGLNLHHRCRLVINLDIPWTPLRFEQRAGRVDRIGQLRRVHALTLVARGTADDHAAQTLASRSTRAEHEAPFGTAADDLLQRDATAEAARLERVRALRRGGLTPRSSRPVLTLLRRRSQPHGAALLVFGARMLVADASGAIVWSAVKGFALPARGGSDRGAARLLEWFERLMDTDAVRLAAVVCAAHCAECAAVQREIRDALEPLVARERSMLAHLVGRRARLAAPLLQQGLFDRRAVREADAQQRIVQEAVAEAEARIQALDRQSRLFVGDCDLVFASAWTR